MEENNKEVISESLKKSLSLMNFKPGMTRTENNEIIEEQMSPSVAGLTGNVEPRQTAPSQKKLDRQDRRDTFKSNKEKMSRSDARKLKRADRRSDRKARKNDDEVDSIESYVERIYNHAESIDSVLAELEGKMFDGQDGLTAVKAAYKKAYGEDIPGTAPAVAAKPAYKPKFPKCTGGVNKVGCRSNAVAQVQSLVGGLDNKIKIDGMFGKRTKAAIEKVAPEFAEQFTDADVAKIKQKVQAAGVDPEAEAAARAKAAAVKGSKERMSAGINKMNKQASDRVSVQNKRTIDTIPNPAPLGEDEIEVKEDMFEKPKIKSGGYNMSQGFVNESISQKERVRKNKQERLDRKFGRV